MSGITTKGTCQLCQTVLSKSGMTRHLGTCLQKAADTTSTQKAKKAIKLLHLQVEGRGQPQYWMHLELPADATLETLDAFLRSTWLECCGHMSKFDIGGVSYSSYPDPEFGDKSMRAKVGTVLSPGGQFFHEYDFGTTTELRLKVVAERQGQAKGKSVGILARNEPPQIVCKECGKPATEVCTECIYDEGGGWLCETCAGEHECGEDMLLPVANSPRVGMCGYAGSGE